MGKLHRKTAGRLSSKNGVHPWQICILMLATGLIGLVAFAEDVQITQISPSESENQKAIAAVISCKGMIDDGLYKSIKRRSQMAMDEGATYLIYEIGTYGGLVKSGDDISDFFILDAGKKVHTVAYITTKAISAGAMISVSCKDIIMLKHTTIGDCAPITMGGELKGVEREKAESFIRGIFSRAAEANGYPEPLLKAMVSQHIEVYSVKNIQTKQLEFFETKNLPTDPNAYDIKSKKLVVGTDEILTLTSEDATEYGISRTEVSDLDEALAFLEKRDGVKFSGKPVEYELLWSEQMVRWINSPAVMGILVMLTMLGVYMELNTPGLGLPGLVAVICIVIIVGSKFLAGMANWVEIAIFVTGILLLLVEIFVIPGFGIAGLTGIFFIILGGFGMLVKNAPDQLPIPRPEFGGWEPILDGLVGVSAGLAGFVFFAVLLARYMPKVAFLSGLSIEPAPKSGDRPISMTTEPESEAGKLEVGQGGIADSILRPAGQARFENAIVDVVAQGEYVKKGENVEIVEIHGNRVVVRKA